MLLLVIIYHLIASEDQEVVDMLSNMVVIVDPMMNPDGRDRFAKSLEQYRGTAQTMMINHCFILEIGLTEELITIILI